MKLYSDNNLSTPIENAISFGVVPVGDTKTLELWLKNDSSPRVTGLLKNLVFNVQCFNPDTDEVIESEKVNVIEAPKEMSPYAVAKIVLEWSPAVDLEAGLKAKLTISGNKVIG